MTDCNICVYLAVVRMQNTLSERLLNFFLLRREKLLSSNFGYCIPTFTINAPIFHITGKYHDASPKDER